MKRLQKWPPHSLTTPLRRYMRSTCKPFAITSRSSPARALRKRLRSTRRRWLEGRGCWYGKIIWWFESFAISKYWLVLWNMNGLWRSIYWECHDPNWRTHIFQRGRYTTNQMGMMILTFRRLGVQSWNLQKVLIALWNYWGTWDDNV